MKYVIDIDGTICNEVFNSDGSKNYALHEPMMDRITRVNALYEAGHTIKYMTARGAISKIDHTALTTKQLADWGAKYHELSVGKKEHYDMWVDDKAFWSESFFRQTGETYE